MKETVNCLSCGIWCTGQYWAFKSTGNQMVTSLCRIITAWLKWWCSRVADVPYNNASADPDLQRAIQITDKQLQVAKKIMKLCCLFKDAGWLYALLCTKDHWSFWLTWLEMHCWYHDDPGHGIDIQPSVPESLCLLEHPGTLQSATGQK